MGQGQDPCKTCPDSHFSGYGPGWWVGAWGRGREGREMCHWLWMKFRGSVYLSNAPVNSKQPLSPAWRRRWGSATVLIKIRLWLQSAHLQAKGFLLPCWWGRSCFPNKDNAHVLPRATCAPDFLTGIVGSAEAPPRSPRPAGLAPDCPPHGAPPPSFSGALRRPGEHHPAKGAGEAAAVPGSQGRRGAG